MFGRSVITINTCKRTRTAGDLHRRIARTLGSLIACSPLSRILRIRVFSIRINGPAKFNLNHFFVACVGVTEFEKRTLVRYIFYFKIYCFSYGPSATNLWRLSFAIASDGCTFSVSIDSLFLLFVNTYPVNYKRCECFPSKI